MFTTIKLLDVIISPMHQCAVRADCSELEILNASSVQVLVVPSNVISPCLEQHISRYYTISSVSDLQKQTHVEALLNKKGEPVKATSLLELVRRHERYHDCTAENMRILTLKDVVTPKLMSQALFFLRALLEVLFDGLEEEVIRELNTSDVWSALHTMLSWTETSFVKMAKYVVSAPMSNFLRPPKGDPLATLPEFNLEKPQGFNGHFLLFSGHLKRILKLRLVARTERNFRFWFGWLMSKKGGDTVPDSIVEDSLIDHAKALSTNQFSDLPNWADRVELDCMLAELKTFTKRLIRVSGMEKSFTAEKLLDKEFQRSSAACWESSRSTGGLLGAIVDDSSVTTTFARYQSKNGPNDHLEFGSSLLFPEVHEVLLSDRLPIPIERTERRITPRHVIQQCGYDFFFGRNQPLQERPVYMGVRGAVVKEDGTVDLQQLDELLRHQSAEVDQSRVRAHATDETKETTLSRELMKVFDLHGNPFQLPSFGLIMRDHSINCPSWYSTLTQAIGIVEPFKVRVITKGNGTHQFIGKNLQRVLWTHLKELPTFKLIGQPVDGYVLEEMEAKRRELGIAGDYLVSGDYKAATDKLRICVTKAIGETIFSRVRKQLLSSRDATRLSVTEVDALIDSYRRCLYEQTLVYNLPRARAEDLLRTVPGSWSMMDDGESSRVWCCVEQKTGQLMGSVLSFVVLCIANGFGYWRALKDVFPELEVKPEDMPCRINGDDIMFRGDAKLYLAWSERIRLLGFTKSVGKNYAHPRFGTVNSTPILVDGQGMLRVEKQMNVGLMIGITKLVDDNINNKPVSKWYEEVVFGSLNPQRAHARFFFYHRQLIEKLTFNGLLNCFADTRLGGLGFPIHPAIPPSFSRFQRVLARVFLDRILADNTITPIAKISSGSRQSKVVFTRRPAPEDTYWYTIGPLPRGVEEVSELQVLEPANCSKANQLEAQWELCFTQRELRRLVEDAEVPLLDDPSTFYLRLARRPRKCCQVGGVPIFDDSDHAEWFA